jgi:hypothetical protein
MPCFDAYPNDSCSVSCCKYPNGTFQIVLGQIFLFFALWLSLSAMGDCEFVTAKLVVPEPFFPGLPHDVWAGGRSGVGFFTFQQANGNCYYGPSYNKELAHWYFDYLGSDWRAARVMGTIVFVAGWPIWFWTLAFACIAHIRSVRYVLAGTLVLVLSVLQLLTVLIVRSDFCERQSCELGRSGFFSVASGLCLIISGLAFFFSKDHTHRSARVKKMGLKDDPEEIKADMPEEEALTFPDVPDPSPEGVVPDEEAPVFPDVLEPNPETGNDADNDVEAEEEDGSDFTDEEDGAMDETTDDKK